MFGDRLSSADFAFYGQMTPGAHARGASPVMRDEAPMTFSWLIDMSGWEPGPWQDQEQPPCQAVMDLLGLCGGGLSALLQRQRGRLAGGRRGSRRGYLGHDLSPAAFQVSRQTLSHPA